jgi:hypothetical protein
MTGFSTGNRGKMKATSISAPCHTINKEVRPLILFERKWLFVKIHD